MHLSTFSQLTKLISENQQILDDKNNPIYKIWCQSASDLYHLVSKLHQGNNHDCNLHGWLWRARTICNDVTDNYHFYYHGSKDKLDWKHLIKDIEYMEKVVSHELDYNIEKVEKYKDYIIMK
jgi:predicted protein tyrosine phosphatase